MAKSPFDRWRDDEFDRMKTDLDAIAALVAQRTEVGTVARVTGLVRDLETIVDTLGQVSLWIDRLDFKMSALVDALGDLQHRDLMGADDDL